MKDSKPSDKLTYETSGVSPQNAADILGEFAARQKKRPRNPAVLAGIGPFAACYSLREVVERFGLDAVSVSSCDGVGTKAKLALQWNRFDRLGEDLVAMNVNDLLCAGAVPAFFLDYYACGKLRRDQLLPLLESIQQGCELAGCSLVGGETAEMPGVYAGEDFDLAGFSVGFAHRAKLLGPERVREGDVLIGFPSSGLHSNGYSLVRAVIEREKIQPEAPTPFGEGTWAECLLRPTTIYVSAVKDVLPQMHALVHVTGGGVYENVPRALPDTLAAELDAKAWALPPLFQYFAEKARMPEDELRAVLNCGIGLVAFVAPEDAAAVTAAAAKEGITTRPLGRVVARGTGEAVRWQKRP